MNEKIREAISLYERSMFCIREVITAIMSKEYYRERVHLHFTLSDSDMYPPRIIERVFWHPKSEEVGRCKYKIAFIMFVFPYHISLVQAEKPHMFISTYTYELDYSYNNRIDTKNYLKESEYSSLYKLYDILLKNNLDD